MSTRVKGNYSFNNRPSSNKRARRFALAGILLIFLAPRYKEWLVYKRLPL